MTRTVVFLTLLFFTFSSFAQESLEWQKANMEEKISYKIRMGLGNLLEPGQFQVEVESKVNDPGLPNFDDLEKIGPKISDIKFDESKGDYIAFSKVGLEVPVIDKFYKNHQMKLKELYRFNEGFDLYKNLESVKITVFLDTALTPAKSDNAKLLVQNMKFATGEVKPQILFEKLALKQDPPPKPLPIPKVDEKKEDKLTQKDILQAISRLGNAIGLILATLMFGIFAYILLKKWFEAMKALKEMKNPEEETKEASKEDKNPEDPEEVSAEVVAEELVYAEASSEDNFARFKKFFETSKEDSVLMIKKWISSDDESTIMGLRALAQQLTDEELMTVFQGLNSSERAKWKGHIQGFLTPEEVTSANKFISEEVVREMIGPDLPIDAELVDMILNISPEVACKFIESHPNESKVLMNLVSAQFTNRIMTVLDDKKVEEVITNSLSFDFKEVTDGFTGFKGVLKKFLDESQKRPFNDKIMQMLPDFNPTKEGMLYQFLAQSGMRSDMVRLAKQYFPADLIMKLPHEFIKLAMQNYPTTKKVSLLVAVEDETREKLLSSFAEKGTTAREMLDLEFSNIESDEMLKTRIKRSKDELWKDFVIYVRHTLNADKSYQSDIDSIIKDWSDDLITSNQSSTTSRKLA